MKRSTCWIAVIGWWLAGALAALPASAQSPSPSLLFFQNSQDQARSLYIVSSAAGPTVSAFGGAIIGNARNIQADGDDDLLWYADTSGNIASKVISTNAAGPIILAAAFAGANSGGDRHFSLDPYQDRLYYSVTDDTVQIIDMATSATVGSFPSAAFAGAIIGGYRHTTVDPVNRLLYYASTNDAIYSFSLDDYTVAGPTIPADDVDDGAATGGYRHIIYDPTSELLWYSSVLGSVRSVNPTTLAAGPTIPAGDFIEILGANRIISIAYDVVPEPGALALHAAAVGALCGIARRRFRTS